MENTKSLHFIKDAVYNGVVVYDAGSTYDVPSDHGYADRWLKRGIAIPAEDIEAQAVEDKKYEERNPVKEESEKKPVAEKSQQSKNHNHGKGKNRKHDIDL